MVCHHVVSKFAYWFFAWILLLITYFVSIICRWWVTNTIVIDTVVSPSMDANIMIVTEWGESLPTWVPAPRISVLAEYTSFPTAKGLDSPKTYWIKENLFISRQLDINIGIVLSYGNRQLHTYVTQSTPDWLFVVQSRLLQSWLGDNVWQWEGNVARWHVLSSLNSTIHGIEILCQTAPNHGNL